MAPLATVAAETAATAATYHTLVARKLSSNGLTTLICIALVIFMFLPLILMHAITHFKKGGTVKDYFIAIFVFIAVTIGCIVICIPWAIVMLFFGKRLKKRKDAKAAAAAAAGTGTAAATAATAAEPPPLARPTMPLDPVELAPEEPDLDEPDDPTSYLRRAPPAPQASQEPAPPAAADDGSPPTFEEAAVQKPEAAVLRPEPPPPAYQPAGSSRDYGVAL